MKIRHSDNPVARSAKRLLVAGMTALAAAIFSPAAEKPHLVTRWENLTPADGMPDAKVFCVTVDGDRVWAGTEDGLALIEHGKVTRVFKPEDGLAHRVVMGIAVDPSTHDLWLATFGGVSHFSGGHFENFTNLTSGLLNDICYGIAVEDRFVWVATTAGISRYNLDTGEWTDWSEKNAPFHEPWTYGVSPADNIGKIYFAMWGGGLIEYDKAQGYMKAYTDPDGEMEIVLFRNQGLIHVIVSGVSYNPDNKIVWASTYFGLSGYDGRDWHNYLTIDSGLASDFINAPKSRRNEVWACTDQGLSMLDYSTNTWVTYRPDHEKGQVAITWPDGGKEKLYTATALAHNYILNMDFQGEDIWVATAHGLSHGIREPQKEALLYANVRNNHGPRGRTSGRP